jgi:hypothetical protein
LGTAVEIGSRHQDIGSAVELLGISRKSVPDQRVGRHVVCKSPGALRLRPERVNLLQKCAIGYRHRSRRCCRRIAI